MGGTRTTPRTRTASAWRRPATGVPHPNQFDDELLAVPADTGTTRISSACNRHHHVDSCADECGYGGGEPPCGAPDRFNLARMPSGAATRWEPAPGTGMSPVGQAVQEIEEITNSIASTCIVVIRMPPMDSATDDERIDEAPLRLRDALLEEIASRPEVFEVVGLDEVEPRCR